MCISWGKKILVFGKLRVRAEWMTSLENNYQLLYKIFEKQKFIGGLGVFLGVT